LWRTTERYRTVAYATTRNNSSKHARKPSSTASLAVVIDMMIGVMIDVMIRVH
jgi:hypothetical protein